MISARPTTSGARRGRSLRLAVALTSALASVVLAASPAAAWPMCGW